MPTARELLEQADALMRRNRRRDRDKPGGPPTLTDALGLDRESALAPTVILPDVPRDIVDPSSIERPADPIALEALADPIALDTLSDVPVLTDVVDVWPAGEARNGLVDAIANVGAEPATGHVLTLDEALEADALAAHVEDPDDVESSGATAAGFESADAFPMQPTQPSVEPADAFPMQPPDVVAQPVEVPKDDERDDRGAKSPSDAAKLAALPPFDEEFILDIPPPAQAGDDAREADVQHLAVSGATAPAAVRPGSPDWDAMAEEIRMQVLQRLDLFTDTGMRDQLGARLRPIVDRASAELVETINHQLGELVRGYVAEAIEREIESWRKREE